MSQESFKALFRVKGIGPLWAPAPPRGASQDFSIHKNYLHYILFLKMKKITSFQLSQLMERFRSPIQYPSLWLKLIRSAEKDFLESYFVFFVRKKWISNQSKALDLFVQNLFMLIISLHFQPQKSVHIEIKVLFHNLIFFLIFYMEDKLKESLREESYNILEYLW